MPDNQLSLEEPIELTVTRMAHGGEGIANAPDGRIVFVGGGIPGDTARVTLTQVNKRWARGHVDEILDASGIRVEPTCPAAAQGAGCCGFSHIAEEKQLGMKVDVLTGQLSSLASRSGVFAGFDLSTDVESVQLSPAKGWRTRVRLGVDATGHAGLRKNKSHDLVSDVACTQVVPGLLDGIVGENAATFTPGVEVVAVGEREGTRHIVETKRVQRGQRIESIDNVIEGSGTVTETVSGYQFEFPATAFWQAHSAAPTAYSDIISTWGAGEYERRVGWDLYGGVGAFVPAIDKALGGSVHIDSVDFSSAAATTQQKCLAGFDLSMHRSKVESVSGLAEPGLVVLDPPRAGAGDQVVGMIANARPERVIHVGCDPATFARDLGYWGQKGFQVKRLLLIDAFPNTHHFEVMATLEPTNPDEDAATDFSAH